jgi:nucleoside-diphosphate-sugar epimerase
MNILVTGANGFLGKKLCETLTQQNHNVSAVIRSNDTIVKNTQLIIKQLSKETIWDDVLSCIDVVIHLAGRAHVMKEEASDPYQAYAEINVDATRHLAEQAALNGVKRFIFLSSVKVNGESTKKSAFTESDQPQPEDDYGKTKYEAEKALSKIAQETEMEVVIIRPPLVYGKGVKANFKNLIKLSQSGLPMPFGAVHNKRSLIYIENLIDFIMVCIDHPQAANQTFLVSDDHDVSTTQLIKSIANASGKKSRLIPIPNNWLTFMFKLLGKPSLSDRLCGNLQVDISKAKTLLSWKPPFSFKDGIARTVQIDK